MTSEPSMEQVLLTRLTEIVEQHLDDEQFGVSELAHEAGMSRSQLHRKLKRITGQSVSQFIREIRLQHALDLLQNNVATASEIAYRVGFSSPSYFSKCFSDYYGLTPGEAKDRVPVTDHSKEDLTTISNRPWLSVAAVMVVLVIGTSYFVQSRMPALSEDLRSSLAVLPFENLTGDPELEFIVEGIHDVLIGELGNLNSIRVISRTSTLPFRNSDSSMEEIAERLNVENLIEGTVFGTGDTVRIQLKLVSPGVEEGQLWSGAYISNMGNVITTLSKITGEIAAEIDVAISEEDRQQLSKPDSVAKEVLVAYVRGKHYINIGTFEDAERGIAYLHEALDLDPASPLANAGLARVYVDLGHGLPFGVLTPSEIYFQRAKAAAQVALQLDPLNALAHSALGAYYAYFERDWDKAEEAFMTANELNPSLAWNHYHYAWFLYLAGKEEQAIYEHTRAHVLDPMNPLINGWHAWLFAYYGMYDEAEIEIEKTFSLRGNYPVALLAKGLIYFQQGKYEEAIPYYRRTSDIVPLFTFNLGSAYALAGNTDQTREIISTIEQKDQITSIDALSLATMHAALGELDEAFEWLEYEPAHPWVPFNVLRTKSFESLRNDPRFQDFVVKYDLFDFLNVEAYTSN